MKDLGLWIISVSSYEDNGRLMQYAKLLMPPAGFLILRALALEAARDLGVSLDIFCVNERAEAGESYLEKIISAPGYGEKLVFLSAKTFELPRAIDVARRLKRAGLELVIGGAGITLADWKTYDFLVKGGISFNVGEGEETIKRIIKDFLAAGLRPVYWQRNYVDLKKAPLPIVPDGKDRAYRFSLNRFAGINTSEGCPHSCSFCCVTKLRGRAMTPERAREPEAVVEWIQKTHQQGLPIFLLDDNFRRSPVYQNLLEKLIKLNEQFNRSLRFFIQLDATPDVIKEIPRLARMGVRQVFLGIETLNVEILVQKKKAHNQPAKYREIVDAFHKYGILVTAGWMVGFPWQTSAAILTEAYKMSCLFDLVALFRVVPLPGSADFFEAVENQEIIEWDPNYYDSTHFVRRLYGMSQEQAKQSCNRAFLINHSFRHMLHGSPGLRLRVFRNNFYGRFIAELGRLFRGKPYQFIMDGIPRFWPPFAWRPQESFRGFPLTIDDLNKKESFLEGLVHKG